MMCGVNLEADSDIGTQLRPACVLGTTEDTCTVHALDRTTVLPYAKIFPAPRVERVSPGHLVALATAADGSHVVAWRWFDAVVIEVDERGVTLWEPGHGVVVAQPREPARSYHPGSRAYLSAGLPGADWWVAGPVVERAEQAEVELAEVHSFFTDNDLWHRLG
jgi:hypothetical protein